MKKTSDIARCLPVALMAIFSGTALVVANPGLFWDDWVWIVHDQAQAIAVGRELGIWWGGYLTNAINALPNPVLAMRVTALVAWVVAGAALSVTLCRCKLLSGENAFLSFLLYCAFPVGMIRFINSVAMYNVYIASFWIGCLIVVLCPRSGLLRFASLPFFYLSFFLNSLIALYGLFLLMLFFEFVPRSLRLSPGRLLSDPGSHSDVKRSLIEGGGVFLKKEFVFVIAPVLFLISVRLTRQSSPFYDDYNSVGLIGMLHGAVQLLTTPPVLLGKYLAWLSSGGIALILLVAAVYFALLLLMPKAAPHRATLRGSGRLLAAAVVILAVGLYPYLVVGKPPKIGDFYEGREILVCVPGIILLIMAAAELAAAVLPFSLALFVRPVRYAVVALVLGASSFQAFFVGVDFWRDWIRQEAIAQYIEDNKDFLGKNFSTFIFDEDISPSFTMGGRYIWNYEYTGQLVKIFGKKTKFGISVNEYKTLTPHSALLFDPRFRDEYNTTNYTFDDRQAIIYVRNGNLQPHARYILRDVAYYFMGGAARQRLRRDLSRFLTVSSAKEYIEAKSRLATIAQTVNALYAYKDNHGYFPTSLPAVEIDHVEMPVRALGMARATAWVDEIPGLSPDYVPSGTLSPVCRNWVDTDQTCRFLYLSDGKDFKLVYEYPADLSYAKQAYPNRIDPRRPAYGVWTKGAEDW